MADLTALAKRMQASLVPPTCDEMRLLMARLIKLEAVVARLPQTADGVPVWRGDWVWVDCDEEGIVRCELRDESPDDGHDWHQWQQAAMAYSTRSAAEAARKAKDHALPEQETRK